jgi:hypothetical protein
MEQNIETQLDLKEKFINFYKSNKLKILIFSVILSIVLIIVMFLKYFNEKQNIMIAEKYIKAGLYLSSNKKENAKEIYEEIILSKNKFYSILALNTILEKDLITNKEKILKYFNIIEKSTSTKDQKDLIALKKAIYLIKELKIKEGNDLLNKLISDNSILKPIAEELVKN